MRSTFRVFCYIDRQKVRADGTTAVWCRLSIDGKRAVLTTGIYCRPEMWDPRRGEILSPRENNHLEAFRQRVVRTYEQMLEEQGVVSAAMLKERLVGRHSTPLYRDRSSVQYFTSNSAIPISSFGIKVAAAPYLTGILCPRSLIAASWFM